MIQHFDPLGVDLKNTKLHLINIQTPSLNQNAQIELHGISQIYLRNKKSLLLQ
jgi:hypothetical protein